MIPTQDIASYITQIISTYTGNSSELTPQFLDLFRPVEYDKGSTFLPQGELWDKFSIVSKGLVRLYYIDTEGKEFTKGLFPENHILAPCAPSAIREPSNFTIEIFEPSTLLIADYAKVRAALEATPWGPFLLINLLEQVLEDKVDREYIWLTLDAEARYLRFRNTHPDLCTRLPLYIIANYLGMTDVTLSRIRKKLDLT